MMGLHHNYPLLWGPERMEGLTLDLGLDVMFSPLPTELTVGSKEPERCWIFDSSQKQEQLSVTQDTCDFLQEGCVPGTNEGTFETSRSYSQWHQQELVDVKVERDEVLPGEAMVVSSLPMDLTPIGDALEDLRAIQFPGYMDLHGNSDVKRDRTLVSEQGNRQSKRARWSIEHEQTRSPWVEVKDAIEEMPPVERAIVPELKKFPFIDVNEPVSEIESIDTSELLQQDHKPLIDVNQAIRQMPHDTAEAFMELFRFVGAPSAQDSQPVNEMDSRHFSAPDSCLPFHQGDSQPATGNASFLSRTFPELVSVTHSSILSRPFPESGNSNSSVVSRALHEIERDPCSLVPVYEQHVEKNVHNGDVVLYEPKMEPVGTWRENSVGSVVHVKQEFQEHANVSDVLSTRNVGESAVGPCQVSRKLVSTALTTFERCRQHILTDPSYGQTILCTDTSKGKGRLRADLKAACLMRKKGFWLNENCRPIGEVPGVVVGDCFRYRIEMAVIGLHRAVQAGIAVVPLVHSPYGKPIASSVVIGVADPYQDDQDMGDTVVYSGQGGLCGKTKESQDQELKRGNLALNNSYEFRLPVRLIRGHKHLGSKTGILYSYDGLYMVVEVNYVTGVNGKKVYKFTMHRLPGQPPIFCPPLEGSQPPISQTDDALCWMQPTDVNPLYLEK